MVQNLTAASNYDLPDQALLAIMKKESILPLVAFLIL